VEHLNILISHAYDERELAEAWKTLIETTSSGVIKVWYSSDMEPSGGITLGREWREGLYQRLKECQYVLAILTPASVNRPWIMWECGVASGLDKIRGIIPIVYGMGRGDLANPLATYHTYQGEDTAQVREVCQRLAREAELVPPLTIYDEPLKVYFAVIHQRRHKVLRAEEILLWLNRFEQLVQSGRTDELYTMRQRMYASFGTSFHPIEPRLHEVLSQLLLDQRYFAEAIEEVDYALKFADGDVDLLYRKALANVELLNLKEGTDIIESIMAQNADLRVDPEIASLLGRIHREKWTVTRDPQELALAFETYYAAYQAHKTAYFPGINAANLAFLRGDNETGMRIAQEVLTLCQELQQNPNASYWVDLTIGEAYLGLGKTDLALAAYQQALKRTPVLPQRVRNSALKGVYRMVEARKLPVEVVQQVQTLLTP
jgi:tetratricopeptide (TPR) repeat protein